jgi:CDP-diacylglycerol---glycerol-3-phosphate 3-phosphatidyltransferase
MAKLQVELTLPNQLTLLRILLTPVFVFCLLADSAPPRQISLLIFVIAALTDWYDGWAARKLGYTSRIGKFMDPLADKVLSSAALLSFSWLGLVDAWMVWVVIVRDFLITGLRTMAEFHDQPIVTSRSAQAKTFGQFVVIYYILILYVAKTVPAVTERYGPLVESLMDSRVLFGMMLGVTLTTVGTGIAYCWDNRAFITQLYGRFRTPA